MLSVQAQQSNATPLTVLQSRMVDEIAIHRFGMLGLVLMENAGRGAADFVADLVNDEAKFVVVCGTGNNGGDGLVIARHLHARGLSNRSSGYFLEASALPSPSAWAANKVLKP